MSRRIAFPGAAPLTIPSLPLRVLGFIALLLLPHVAMAQTASHLQTKWARDVNPDHVLPDYPRPQMARAAWQNLNGFWDYTITDSGAPRPTAFDGKILVPFAIESQLSRVQKTVTEKQNLWYRRTFTAPALAKGGRLLLHFGAVDWDATVFVNGQQVGTHQGGYDPFTFDVTDALKGTDAQELIVRVWDPTDKGPQPRGKQVQKPEAIWYTSVTGIWQTVWLEPVAKASIADLTLTTDIDAGTITVRVKTEGTAAGEKVRVTAFDGAHAVAKAEGATTDAVIVRIPKPKLWSPDSPFLYPLTIRLASGDSVMSYIGMRKIAVARDSTGMPRLFLNNHPLFQYGPLDQGWWPEGLYTAPTDDALRWDIEQTKQLGFNMIRKHVKVEPARWYYYADKLGMLVWQDMPSALENTTPAAHAIYERELKQMVDALHNVTSIVVWVPFNEGWGQHDTKKYVTWLKGYEPTRLVNNASGWVDMGVGDLADAHAYPNPGIPGPDSVRARVLGEFGGLGLPISGHTWIDENNWGYRTYKTKEELGTAYKGLMHEMRYLIAQGLCAAVYTQTTDVEIEVNGLWTYDREVLKLPADAIATHATLHGPMPMIRVVMPTSYEYDRMWRYTKSAPADSSWIRPDFTDDKWHLGLGGFGLPVPMGYALVHGPLSTVWETPDLWLRSAVTLPATPLAHPHWRIFHVGDTDVFLNGQLVGHFEAGTPSYSEIPFNAAALAAMRPGANTLAIHVSRTRRLQYFDIGIDDVTDSAGAATR